MSLAFVWPPSSLGRLLSYAKQYCRYGMEVAMLASITVKKKPHVGAETGMGTAFPAALGAPSLPSCSAATCKRQKVAAGRHQCKSNFFRLPSPGGIMGGIFANQLPGWLRISVAANFASLSPTFPTPALLPSFPPAGARSGMTAHQSGGALHAPIVVSVATSTFGGA